MNLMVELTEDLTDDSRLPYLPRQKIRSYNNSYLKKSGEREGSPYCVTIFGNRKNAIRTYGDLPVGSAERVRGMRPL